MSVNLSKGQAVSLEKTRFDLSQITIGCGWDVRKPGLFGRLTGASSEEYDLDLVAIALQHGRLVHTGDERLRGSDVVFFNNKSALSGAIELGADNRNRAGDGDDEEIYINLTGLPDSYDRIVLLVQIYEGRKRNQSFANIENAYVRAVDFSGKEMARFRLTGGQARSIVFAELRRRSSEDWDFAAIGELSPRDSFIEYLDEYARGQR